MEDWRSAEDRLEHLRGVVARELPNDGDLTGTALALHRICRATGRILPARAVAVSLMTETGTAGVAAALDDASSVIEELQFILGEGPGWDAFETRSPVLAPHLTGEAARRWPGYCVAVGAHGVRAAFAFPLTVGSARLGVMGVYRQEAGPLPDRMLAEARALADLATQALLDGQDQTDGAQTPAGLDGVLASRFAVYQAQGMVMIQLGVSLTEAMARMRAHAYSSDRTLGSVARDVVARRLSFDGDDR